VTTARYAALAARLGHRFTAPALLEQALTHRSRGAQNNERLEFLGDGVLGCVVADELYARFPHLPEGKLTRMRAGLVREEALAEIGESLGLRELLRLGTATPATTSILADAVEAVFGAVFLDGGYAAARAAAMAALAPLMDRLDAGDAVKDAKTQLQEILQGTGEALPEYRLLSQKGPPHDVECVLAARGLRTTGSGSSRQRAEQQAALAMLARLAQ
jgi:ribonuclease-3